MQHIQGICCHQLQTASLEDRITADGAEMFSVPIYIKNKLNKKPQLFIVVACAFFIGTECNAAPTIVVYYISETWGFYAQK